MRRALVLAILLCLAMAPSAQSAPEDPLFVFTPEPQTSKPPPPAIPPPSGYFEGPCGLAVDSEANLYVSDYYPEEIADHNAVDVFGPNLASYPYDYRTQIRHIDPIDGPCGLAVGAAGTLFVNDYHRSVLRYETSVFPPPKPEPFTPPFPTHYGAASTIDTAHPTGVALDPTSARLYVNNRTHISVYDSSGAPLDEGGGTLEEGEEQLRIGASSLEDGYGLAVSGFPATAGRLYVVDAASDTVKVYDPSVDLDEPVAEIDGTEVPGGEFVSLRDSALAVDRVSGKLYLADNRQPQFTEYPQAAIYVFDSSGTYLGRLKHNVIDALPPGLAVDNSAKATQGRVYVTSGNTEFASVYVYGPNAETDLALPPLPSPAPGGPFGGVAVGSALTTGTPSAPSPRQAGSTLVQKGGVRLALSGGLAPRSLPRRQRAPIGIDVEGRLSTIDGTELPKLHQIRIEFNRNGQLQTAGLPSCDPARIRIASTSRAASACRAALLGEGRFEADVILAGQEPYPTEGRLLMFNGSRGERQRIYGHLYAPRPFATSFLISFSVRHTSGRFGTVLEATLPRSFDSWGRLRSLAIGLERSYRDGGQRHSVLSANCPLPKGIGRAAFPLARTTFVFRDAVSLGAVLSATCRARG